MSTPPPRRPGAGGPGRPAGRRRPVSRRVRLHRTIAATIVLCLLVVGIVALRHVSGSAEANPADRGPAPAAGSTPTSTTATSRTTPTPTARAAATKTPPARQRTSSPVPRKASGHLVSVPVPGKDTPGQGRRVTYAVQVERGLGADTGAIAKMVYAVLHDRRGWQTKAKVRFVHVTAKQQAAGRKVDITVSVVSPTMTDKLCYPLKTESSLDCYNQGRAILNYARWQRGAKSYGKDLQGYRTYLINHEVGHGLGQGHQQCDAAGTLAPVMLQQSISLKGCTPWPWPTRPATAKR